MFTFGIISIELWPSHMPVWALVIALLIGNVSRVEIHTSLTKRISEAFTYIIPVGMIQAITNQQMGLKYIWFSFISNVLRTLQRYHRINHRVGDKMASVAVQITKAWTTDIWYRVVQ